ncbi:unnamed protein product [Phytophthora lilii]|uniref:Unnamed protein product n=1 Tax=Phytophthora lilii TaxID=2077276 RepID=A0A9W6WQV3_9STRA|nr:unnamed protein product [Phytophthora lilii]
MQAAFYCSDCRKQYKTVTEMENHLSSYDHHHTKRLKELQLQQKQRRRVGSEEEQSAKRRKEQQQEETMLQRRIAAQAEAAHAVAPEPNATAKTELGKQKAVTTSTVGFSFGGGMKMGSKKQAKKALRGQQKKHIPSAFTSPFSR